MSAPKKPSGTSTQAAAYASPSEPRAPIDWRALTAEAGRFVAMTGLSIVALSYIFPPRTLWPIAFVCLAPWALAVCRTERAWIVHWGSFLGGWVFFLVNLSWLMPVTGLGYAALAFYLAIYWPMAAWAIRTGRRVGIGPAWTLPVAWVACEYLRGCVMSGFPWLFVAHAFYKHLSFIQISDTTGAYGVSFIVALVNGMIVELGLRWWRSSSEKPKLAPLIAAIAFTVLVLIGNTLYGRYRLEQAEFDEGPRIAVIQEDFPLESTPPYGAHPFEAFARYLSLAGQAASANPDMIVFPETVWQGTQNIEFVEVEQQAVDDLAAGAWAYGTHAHRATAALARGDYATVNEVIAGLERRLGRAARARIAGGKLPRLPAEGGPAATIVLGSISIEVFPEATYPKQKRYNSALVYDPDGTQRRVRYDKIHLVPFGEVVPFRETRICGFSLHWLYRLLNSLSPFSQRGTIEYSLWPGEQFTTFDVRTERGVSRFGIPICYEDVMPYVSRKFAWDGGRRRVDFLLNISNDGWFLYSAELEQHLSICVFRAVENRIGVARAVNTGVSGFIDPNGRIYSVVQSDGTLVAPGVIGYRVDTVKIDRRTTFYGQYGDVFAIVCVVLTSLLWLSGIVTRWIFAARQWWAERRAKRRARAEGAA